MDSRRAYWYATQHAEIARMWRVMIASGIAGNPTAAAWRFGHAVECTIALARRCRVQRVAQGVKREIAEQERIDKWQEA